MIRTAVIGCGYWGPNLIRNLYDEPRAQVRYVCDINRERLEAIGRRYPTVKIVGDEHDVIGDRDVDAVFVATPVETHYRIASAALKAGKHVLIEKPLTDSSAAAQKLIALAKKHKRVLMVDHTFLFTSAVQKMKEIVSLGELGEVYYIDSVRVNLGLFQHDINVVWDLGPHDISIANYVLGQTPRRVSAVGASHVSQRTQDVAYVTLYYPGQLLGHFHVNWLAPVKVRQMLIGGSKKMLLWNDIEPSEKIKVYDTGVTVRHRPDGRPDKGEIYKTLIQYRTGDMYAPRLENVEALSRVVSHFLDCVETGQQPLSDGEHGLQVIRVLEAADSSMKLHGEPVSL
ncbi:Gfo/Idh/MocA family oxidoreductase [Candidatus Sumerlaeota bacterium]|nr:Gfo/Idh/MocA family oxidoreductase [Candidatus Sumerlaeota bacterium]